MTTRTLSGDRVVVIGGSSGIGRAVCEHVVAAGGEAVVGSRGEAARQETVAALGDAASEYAVDLTDSEAIDRFYEQVGSFDHLVLTAAYIPTGGFLDSTDEDVRKAFETKGLGYFRAVKAAREYIDEQGSVTVISAVSAEDPSEDYFALGMANAAVEVLIRSVAAEMGPVRANAVSPSTVDTWGMDDERKARMADDLPAGHVGEPEDVADAVAFCMRNSYLSGEVIRLDGGEGLL